MVLLVDGGKQGSRCRSSVVLFFRCQPKLQSSFFLVVSFWMTRAMSCVCAYVGIVVEERVTFEVFKADRRAWYFEIIYGLSEQRQRKNHPVNRERCHGERETGLVHEKAILFFISFFCLWSMSGCTYGSCLTSEAFLLETESDSMSNDCNLKY